MRGRTGLRQGVWAGLLAAALLAGCATAPPTVQPGQWSGRLALTVESDPLQRWTAGFELTGSPQRGELRLHSPLGPLIAVVRWDGTDTWLDRGDGTPRRYASVEALTAELAGAPLPVGALFAWLEGVAQPVAGWTVDLGQQPQGRLRARRTEPPPAADLRLLWQP